MNAYYTDNTEIAHDSVDEFPRQVCYRKEHMCTWETVVMKKKGLYMFVQLKILIGFLLAKATFWIVRAVTCCL